MSAPAVLVLRGLSLSDYRSPEAVFEARLLGEDAVLGARGPYADGLAGGAPAGDADFLCDGALRASGEHGDWEAEAPPSARIPAKFRRIEDWPLSSPFLCWTCSGPCETPPRFCPTYLRRTPDGDFELGVEGVMCRFACAARYIEDSPLSQTERHRRQTLLLEECAAFTGARPVYIAPGPRRVQLREYGGELSRAELAALADEIEQPLGVPDAAEIRVRAARLAAEADSHAESNALCVNEYKKQVTALGLLK